MFPDAKIVKSFSEVTPQYFTLTKVRHRYINTYGTHFNELALVDYSIFKHKIKFDLWINFISFKFQSFVKFTCNFAKNIFLEAKFNFYSIF